MYNTAEFPVVCCKTKLCVLGTLANTSLMRPSKEIKNEAWFSQATQVQAFVAYASENELRHRHQNQPRHPPFCLNPQTRGIWNECFNWPDVQVLDICSKQARNEIKANRVFFFFVFKF